MGEMKDGLVQGYIDFGRTLAGMMQVVAQGAVLAGADVMGGFAVFVTRHPGIIDTVKSLGMRQNLEEADQLPAIAGDVMLRSLADFELHCRAEIAREMTNPNTNTRLVALLSDAVRLARERGTPVPDAAGGTIQ